MENKKIEKIDLSCKLFKIMKVNQISNKGLSFLKESLKKSIYLKDINIASKQSKIKIKEIV
jgi:hypothetical protein